MGDVTMRPVGKIMHEGIEIQGKRRKEMDKEKLLKDLP